MMKARIAMIRPALRPSRSRCAAIIALAALIACDIDAMAADAPSASASEGPTQSPSQSAPEPLSEVTVTGTRIKARDYSSPSPLVTVGQGTLESTGEVSIDQALSRLPQFSSGNNQFNQSATIATGANASPGSATLNLRGLGSNRNLVLLDGHRMQPANATLAVDINTIPSAAVEGVEVVTGGAGATYGADALSGVVNFKLRHHFQGIQLDAQYGETQRQDDRNTNVSALIGGNLDGGKGNVMLALTFADRSPAYLMRHPFFAATLTNPDQAPQSYPDFVGYDATGNSPTQAAYDAVFGSYPPGTVASSSPIFFNTAATAAAATLFSPNRGAGGQLSPGYTGPLYPHYKYLSDGSLTSNPTPGSYISAPLRRYSLFGDATYEINDNLNVEIQGNFVQGNVQTDFQSPAPVYSAWSPSVPYDAAHPVPAGMATLLNSRPDPSARWTLNEQLDQLGDSRLSVNSNVYQISMGLTGKLGLKDWTWDVYGSLGQTNLQANYNGFINHAAYQTLLDAPDYGAGYSATNFLYGRLASCTSGVNPFVSTPISQDCLDIISPTLKATTEVKQRIVELNFQGAGFALPGGESRFAVGADFRYDGLRYLPDDNALASTIITDIIGAQGTAPVNGSQTVKELYGEASLPVLSGLPAVKKLTVDLGYRYSDYNSGAGKVDTWKALIAWQVNDVVTFRGGPQQANRAPNVAELYTPAQEVVNNWPSGDPCSVNTTAPWGNTPGNPNRAQVIALCNQLSGHPSGVGPITASYPGFPPAYFPLSIDQQVGNPNLKSEQGRTWTVGMVLTSPFESPAVHNMTATLDYYNISLNGAIEPLNSQILYSACLNANGASNPQYSVTTPDCQLIVRQPNGNTSYGTGRYTNLGYVKTAGIDLGYDWSAKLSDLGLARVPGALSANLAASWLQRYLVLVAPGDTAVDYKGSSGYSVGTGVLFSYKTLLTLGYSVGPATVSLRWRHLPAVENAARVLTPSSPVSATDSNDQFDLFGNWRLADAITLRAGIENLTDQDPPRVGATPGQSAAGTTDPSGIYDILGRRFYVGMQVNF